mgnify:CR=1 FL=1
MTRTNIALLVLTCLTAQSRVQASAINEAAVIANGHASLSQAYDGQKTSGDTGIVERATGGGFQAGTQANLSTAGSIQTAKKSAIPMPRYNNSEKAATSDKVAAVGLMAGAGYLMSAAITMFAGTGALVGLLPLAGVAIAGYFAYSLLKGRVHIFE